MFCLLDYLGDDSVGFDSGLPPRLFGSDRYPNGRLNIYSRPDILSFVRKHLEGSEEFDIIIGSALGGLFDFPISQCPPSCKLIHGLICRQVVTKKRYEMWTVYGGQPLRFSLVEFGLITGLSCDEFPEGYDPEVTPIVDKGVGSFWEKLIGVGVSPTLADLSEMIENTPDMPGWRRLRLALLLIVDGVLIASTQTHKPTPKYVNMVEDIESFLKFPWGRESFLKPTPKRMKQETVKLNGFPLVLQMAAFRMVPSLLTKLPNSALKSTMRTEEFVGRAKLTIMTRRDVFEIENSENVRIMQRSY